ncbi:hypothetical protein Golob_002387 [Gossypium lobatum]|uniref:Uncharacterized protein n=1 Tax=Gossypium lobatum TaxID=34289 RepID=A0A7J8N4X6_9ROSI|nr:hypothetical protein [Gossypium lobatum]
MRLLTHRITDLCQVLLLRRKSVESW